MDSRDAPLPSYTSIFGDYKIGGTSRGHAFEPVPASPFTGPTSLMTHGFPPCSQVSKESPPINELAAFSLRPPRCPHCKGKRFDFTAYFHNQRFFPSPPHELIGLVERSYVLRNRLQSLLITYFLHDLREGHVIHDIKADLLDWVRQVGNLAAEIRIGMYHIDGILGGLDGVQAWTGNLANQLAEHLDGCNRKKMDVPKGWKKEILSDFRKQWEKVWILCAKNSRVCQRVVSQQVESFQDLLREAEQTAI